MSKDSALKDISYQAIAGVMAGLVLAGILEGCTSVKVFSWIGGLIKTVGTFLLKPVTLPLVVVAILCLICALSLGGWLIKRGVAASNPPFLEYTADLLHGYKWVWEWRQTHTGNYRIVNPVPFCPECGYEPTPKNQFHIPHLTIRCENCGYEQSYGHWTGENLLERLEKDIQHRARKMLEPPSSEEATGEG